jgi:CRP/FNR family transcriptional regulator
MHPRAARFAKRQCAASACDRAVDEERLNFCMACAFSHVCLSQGIDDEAMGQLDELIDHVGPLKAGDVIFRKGDGFKSIAAVRAGTVKTCVIDREGREHVLGFHLPGEVIGLSAIDENQYRCNAVALDTVMVCQFSFDRISSLATRVPDLQQQLFRLISREIGNATLMVGDWSPDQRMAVFLMDFSRRLAIRGFSEKRFQLTMSRIDIANYLRLAPETVSRVLKRFQDDGLARIDKREIELLDRRRISAIANVLP